MERQISVIAGDNIYDISVTPETTAGQVLRQLHLPDEYSLSATNGGLRADSETLADIPDGGKLFATAPSVVG